ncbi:MAG: thioredoxin-disulfide reductase [Lachnospiraceae bacterium]|nr:thioredoxin-disulfide reductase [Lachnospiraceae bacterium]
MYDLIIVGSGPAGMAAAIYAKRACLDTLVLERTGFGGGQVLNTYEVDNYPGLPGISGFELAQKMSEHAVKMQAKTVEDDVKAIRKENDCYVIEGENNTYETKGIIIATGAKHAHLNVPGEEELAGMGVSYCATCDGAFFTGRDVAVVGGGDVAVEDAIFLARNCRKVYLIHRRDELRAAMTLQNALKACDNVEVIWNTTVEEIRGDDMVSSLTIKNKVSGEVSDLEVSGVFIAVGILPNSEAFADLVAKDAGGYIVAGEDCKTDKPFIYAVGDVRTKPLRQVVTAVADGANAVTSFQKDLLQ